MAIFFPRSDEEYISVERVPREGSCESCGAADLAAYPVLGAKGWTDVVKCQTCLTVASEEPLPIWGMWKPLSADWERSSAG